MPSLIDIRRRIRSVKNTQQITKAMKMVSAAKLRKAQDRVIASRPYAAMLETILSNAAAAAGTDDRVMSHSLLARRPLKRVQMILMTSDRGLAGAFNGNLIKGAQSFAADNSNAEIHYELLGRKGRDFFRRRNAIVTGEHIGIFNKVQVSDAAGIAKSTAERFANGETDAVYLIFNEFKSVLSQKITLKKLLPITLPAAATRSTTSMKSRLTCCSTACCPSTSRMPSFRPCSSPSRANTLRA
jgi:F-type H+-transporting ATPase subunit gamma